MTGNGFLKIPESKNYFFPEKSEVGKSQ